MNNFRGLLLCTVLAATAIVDSSADENTKDGDSELTGDDKVLYDLLLKIGGPPGEVPVEIKPLENPEPTQNDFWERPINDPCTEFAYEYTKLESQQHVERARHEHAIVRYPNTAQEVLDIAGYYFQIDNKGDSSFSLEYSKRGGNETLYSIQVNCRVEQWGVMECSPCLREDYIVHGILSPSCREAGTSAPTIVGKTTLEALVGVEGLPRYAIPDKIDVKWLLRYFGGEVKYDANRRVAPPPEPKDPTERPLPDAPRSSWLYDSRYKNLPKAVRFEHAVRRFQGTPEEFVEIRGVLYWRSNVGDFRVEYWKDDTGLHSSIVSADCNITRGIWRCVYPKNYDPPSCGAGIPDGLLASLLGAG